MPETVQELIERGDPIQETVLIDRLRRHAAESGLEVPEGWTGRQLAQEFVRQNNLTDIQIIPDWVSPGQLAPPEEREEAVAPPLVLEPPEKAEEPGFWTTPALEKGRGVVRAVAGAAAAAENWAESVFGQRVGPALGVTEKWTPEQKVLYPDFNKGFYRGMADTGIDLTAPLAIGTVLTSLALGGKYKRGKKVVSLARKLFLTGISGAMLLELGREIPAVKTAVDKKDYDAAGYAAARGLVTTFFLGQVGRHALRGRGPALPARAQTVEVKAETPPGRKPRMAPPSRQIPAARELPPAPEEVPLPHQAVEPVVRTSGAMAPEAVELSRRPLPELLQLRDQAAARARMIRDRLTRGRFPPQQPKETPEAYQQRITQVELPLRTGETAPFPETATKAGEARIPTVFARMLGEAETRLSMLDGLVEAKRQQAGVALPLPEVRIATEMPGETGPPRAPVGPPPAAAPSAPAPKAKPTPTVRQLSRQFKIPEKELKVAMVQPVETVRATIAGLIAQRNQLVNQRTNRGIPENYPPRKTGETDKVYNDRVAKHIFGVYGRIIALEEILAGRGESAPLPPEVRAPAATPPPAPGGTPGRVRAPRKKAAPATGLTRGEAPIPPAPGEGVTPPPPAPPEPRRMRSLEKLGEIREELPPGPPRAVTPVGPRVPEVSRALEGRGFRHRPTSLEADPDTDVWSKPVADGSVSIKVEQRWDGKKPIFWKWTANHNTSRGSVRELGSGEGAESLELFLQRGMPTERVFGQARQGELFRGERQLREEAAAAKAGKKKRGVAAGRTTEVRLAPPIGVTPKPKPKRGRPSVVPPPEVRPAGPPTARGELVPGETYTVKTSAEDMMLSKGEQVEYLGQQGRVHQFRDEGGNLIRADISEARIREVLGLND